MHTTLASFIAPAGLAPQAAVITDSIGNLYGTTGFGGASGDGTIFELARKFRRNALHGGLASFQRRRWGQEPQ